MIIETKIYDQPGSDVKVIVEINGDKINILTDTAVLKLSIIKAAALSSMLNAALFYLDEDEIQD